MKPTLLKLVPRMTGLALLAAGSTVTALADYPSTIESLSPLAYWRFYSANTGGAINTVTNYSTSVTNAGTGFVVKATKGAPGAVGSSLLLSNPGGAAGYCETFVDIPHNAAFAPNPPFTIEFWADPTSYSSDGNGLCPISQADPNGFFGSDRAGWLFYLVGGNPGNWELRLGNTAGYAGILVANAPTTLGSWQHVVATWDGTNANIYVNGVFSASAPIPVANWVNDPESPLRIGGTQLTGDSSATTADGDYYLPLSSYPADAANRGFDGSVDELAIYPSILSTNVIAAHYAAGTSGSTTPASYKTLVLASSPSGYWNFNEPAVTAPPSSALSVIENYGLDGSAADGTNSWGVLANQPGVPGAFGAVSNAAFFNGETGYFEAEGDPDLQFTNGITLAAWVKPMEDDYFRSIISHGWDGFGAETFLRINRGYVTDYSGDGNYYEMGACDGEFGEFYDSALVPIPAGDIGNWVFLVGTFDGTYWNVYRNGVLAASYAAFIDPNGIYTDTGAVGVTNHWAVGAVSNPSDTGNPGQYFGGSIAEPAVFDYALQPADVANLYAAAQTPPQITQAPINPSPVYSGGSIDLSVWAEGSPTLGYLWVSNGIPTGDTATNFVATGLAVGTYTIGVIVTNAYGTNSPSVSFTVVNEPPFITTQPSSEEFFAGYPFSLSVAAGGTTPITYYWVDNGTVVQAGPSPVYAGTSSPANDGTYFVICSNVTGINATSAPVTLSVTPIPSGNYPAAVLATSPGPIAYWPLNEPPGSPVAFDEIGGNDGTYYDATLGVTGYSLIDPTDTAASFFGVNSYVGNISGTKLNFAGTGNSFTLEAWVNGASGLADQSTIIAKGIGPNGTVETEQFSLDVVGGAYRFFTTYDGTPYAAIATDGPNGTWQYVVGVYDATAQKLEVYVNGVQEGVDNYTLAINGTVSPVTIGSKRTGNDPSYDGTFDGAIDQVAVYNWALDSGTILTHYNAAYGTTLAPEIEIQPVPTTNYEGLPVTISVVAIGSATVTYQWYMDGTPISAANSADYALGSVQYSDAGTYSCVIQNSVGTTNTVTVPLVVLAPPTNPPAIPGLVLHLPFNGTLTDTTGRGNNGTGMFVGLGLNTNFVVLGGVTNTLTPDNTGGTTNPSFAYVSPGNGPFGTNMGLHVSTIAVNTGGSASIGTNDYYVTLGVLRDLQFGTNVSFSISYWIQTPLGYGLGPTYGGGGDLPFFDTAVNSTEGYGIVFATAYGYGTASPNPIPPPAYAGGWDCSIVGSTGAGITYYGNNSTINDANWHHLVQVVNRAANSITTYLDGALAQENLIAGTSLDAAGSFDNGLAATIGQDPTGKYGELGSFQISDLGIWRKALSPLEAASIYTAGLDSSLSYTYVPITFSGKAISPTKMQLTWSFGTLQSATNLAGPWVSLPAATSPYTVSTATNAPIEFFRVTY